MSDKKKSSFKDKLRAFWSVVKLYAKRVWAYLKVAKMEYIVMISLFAFDLITKAIVNATMEVGEVVTVIPYVLNIHNYHNSYAAFGSGWMTDWLGGLGSRIFFCVFAVAASVVFILVLIKHKGGNKLFRVALAMLTAGAMGNCMDRWALSYVRDFIEFVYFGLEIAGSKTFYIFNFADAELVVGVVLVIIYFIFLYKDKSEAKKQEALDASTALIAKDADGEKDKNADGDAENTDGTTDGAEDNGATDGVTETSDGTTEQFDANGGTEDNGATDGAEENTDGIAEQGDESGGGGSN